MAAATLSTTKKGPLTHSPYQDQTTLPQIITSLALGKKVNLGQERLIPLLAVPARRPERTEREDSRLPGSLKRPDETVASPNQTRTTNTSYSSRALQMIQLPCAPPLLRTSPKNTHSLK